MSDCPTGKVILRRDDEPRLYRCRFCKQWHRTSRPPSKRYKAKTVEKAPPTGAVARVWSL